MKKIIIWFAVISTGLAMNSSFAFAYGADSKYSVCVPGLRGGFNFGLTGYYWRASTPELDYALTYPGVVASGDLTGLTLFTNGRVQSADPNYDWAWRANIAYVFACTGSDINLDWIHYDHSHDTSVRVNETFQLLPATRFSGQLLFPSLTDEWPVPVVPVFPGINFLGLTLPVNPTFARADVDFRADAVDLDFGQYINAGCNTLLRFYAGLRYARLEHKLHVFYTGILRASIVGFSGSDLINFNVTSDFSENVNQKTEFDGIGPRFGVHADYAIACSCFSVVADISSSFLVGRINSHLDERLFGATFIVVSATEDPVTFPVGASFAFSQEAFASFNHPNETRIVPNVDAKLGIDYTFEFCNCSRTKVILEAGYAVSHYWDSIDRLSEVAVDEPEFRTRHTLGTSYDGPYLSLQVRL